ncbi:MAG: anhydro-N-acetylmuramic acid kinase [Bacteroidota bacterium]
MRKAYNIIGIMSGSSLDGLDICFCAFEYSGNRWKYRIYSAQTFEYSMEWKKMLKEAENSSAQSFVELDKALGEFTGRKVLEFITQNQIKQVDFIASHGHTVFHNPEKNYTTQIGSGAHIAAVTNIPTITNFRLLDTALGGQGAPLVPIGDELLFSEYDYCLNLGGYSNISYKSNNARLAYDICPVNKALNYFAAKEGKEYDKDGALGRKGKPIKELLTELNQLEFYHTSWPKSLGDDWLNSVFIKITGKYEDNYSIPDILRTIYEHIARQIAKATGHTKKMKILTTGGGAHNQFLIECISEQNRNQFIIPDDQLVDFKESLIFALMGVLRVENINNCLASVTGAKRDNSGGIIFNI